MALGDLVKKSLINHYLNKGLKYRQIEKYRRAIIAFESALKMASTTSFVDHGPESPEKLQKIADVYSKAYSNLIICYHAIEDMNNVNFIFNSLKNVDPKKAEELQGYLLEDYRKDKALREEPETLILEFGGYRLNQNIAEVKEKLEEISSETLDSKGIVRHFEDGQVFKTEPLIFMDVAWERWLSVTDNKIYKISLMGPEGSGSLHEGVKKYFAKLYGRPKKVKSIRPVTLNMWEVPANDPQWNLVIQKQQLSGTVIIFATSRAPFKK